MADNSAAPGRPAQVVGLARAAMAGRARALYEVGVGVREIAESLDRSYGFVRNILVEIGTPLRNHGGHSKRRRAHSHDAL